MAQKRIKMVRNDILNYRVKLLYDDGSQGELNLENCKRPTWDTGRLIGLTRKQAKAMLGIKD